MLLAGCEKKPPTATDRLKQLMSELAEQDYDAVLQHFDPKLRASFTRERLDTSWRTLLRKRGKYQGFVVGEEKEVQGIVLVFITCQFEKGTARVRATFNADGTLGTFAFLPTSN